MAKVGNLTIFGSDVTNLSGIEYFTGLTFLECIATRLTSLDVSGCTMLKNLICFNNQLTSLDLSGCTALGFLDCSRNRLTELNISKNTSLMSLSCFNNQLTALDLSQNTSLSTLQCGNQTRDGVEAQTLTLTLNEGQQATWDADWKNNGFNNNVTVAQ